MPRRRWCACETPEVTDSYRGTVRCDMYDSPEREKGGRLMPLFMMKQRIMETGCVISFSAPFIIISPTTFRGKLTRGHQPPWTTAGNITQRSTYGPFHRIRAPATQTAYGLRANILKLEECEKSQMYSKKKCVCVYTCVCVLLRVSGAVQLLLFCASIDDRLKFHTGTRAVSTGGSTGRTQCCTFTFNETG